MKASDTNAFHQKPRFHVLFLQGYAIGDMSEFSYPMIFFYYSFIILLLLFYYSFFLFYETGKREIPTSSVEI